GCGWTSHPIFATPAASCWPDLSRFRLRILEPNQHMLLRKLEKNNVFRRNGNALNITKTNRRACAAVPIASNGSLRRTASCGILLQHLLTEHGGDWRAACSSAPVSVNSIPPVS
ncbi:unnamed protein product, partial [Ectocarpus sp. 12 AP-2014]